MVNFVSRCGDLSLSQLISLLRVLRKKRVNRVTTMRSLLGYGEERNDNPAADLTGNASNRHEQQIVSAR
jgi:hypothetical protein